MGVKKATCLNNGEWSVALDRKDKSSIKSEVPECTPITCAKPKAPENGAVSADGKLDTNFYLLNILFGAPDLLPILKVIYSHIPLVNDFRSTRRWGFG